MLKKLCIAFIGIVLTTWPAYAVPGEKAIAQIKGTVEDSTVSGMVNFEETSEGVNVDAKIVGAPGGKHGFHIHDKGDCAEKGAAAGGHYNPENVQHGLVMKDGMMHAHVGDLGNIEIMANSAGSVTAFIPGLSITGGKYNIDGRSVILHEKEDDFGQPTGNAGSRIGCGVIISSGATEAHGVDAKDEMISEKKTSMDSMHMDANMPSMNASY